MRVLKFIAIAAALVFTAVPSQAQSSGMCPRDMQMCGTAKTGGGCYNPNYSWCTEEVLCSKGMMGCRAGAYGKGGCIRPNYAFCEQGMICQTGQAVCAPGPNGSGGCFTPGRSRCEGGNIKSY